MDFTYHGITLCVAFRRISGGVSLHAVISIIFEICLNTSIISLLFILFHNIKLVKKIKQKSRQIKFISKINFYLFVFPWLQECLGQFVACYRWGSTYSY
jgi:hypothetical protein